MKNSIKSYPVIFNQDSRPDLILRHVYTADYLINQRETKSIRTQLDKLEVQIGKTIKANENNTEESRMKGVRGLWDLVCEELEMKDVAMKMFRNTFDNKVNETEESKSTFDTITITGHSRTETAESKYLNKQFTPVSKAIATSVDEQYENIIKIRKIK